MWGRDCATTGSENSVLSSNEPDDNTDGLSICMTLALIIVYLASLFTEGMTKAIVHNCAVTVLAADEHVINHMIEPIHASSKSTASTRGNRPKRTANPDHATKSERRIKKSQLTKKRTIDPQIFLELACIKFLTAEGIGRCFSRLLCRRWDKSEVRSSSSQRTAAIV